MATFTLSATCVAIAQAMEAGTLDVREVCSLRFRDSHFTIADQHGLIEIAMDRAELDARLSEIQGRLRAA